MQKGRVIQSTGSWYKVKTENGIIESRLPGRFRLEGKEVTNPIAVGIGWMYPKTKMNPVRLNAFMIGKTI